METRKPIEVSPKSDDANPRQKTKKQIFMMMAER
jgi:hypothetical protein